MTELTEAEIERLVWEFGDHTNVYTLVDTVADLIDARLAPIRDLADEWERVGGDPLDMLSVESLVDADRYGYQSGIRTALRDLRAALSADLTAPQPTSGTQGQDEGDRAGEGCSCVPEGWYVVNPTYMAKLKRLESEHG